MLKLRSDYSPPSFLVQSAHLDISIHDDHTIVAARLVVKRNPAFAGDDELLLHGRDLKLLSLAIDDASVAAGEWQLDDAGLHLSGLPDECVIETRAECHPESNTALEGLYLSGGMSNGMYCTQCEPEGFRRIGFYPDRPDVMTEFTVRIEASKRFPQLLSNGNLIDAGDVGGDAEDERHFALWHDPHPKPSYLFACVVGDLECAADHFVTASGRHVDLHIYVEKGNVDLTGHAMDSLKRSMKWDEDRFGLEYDLDLFQIVAVSHFNMGAMENKGLNIFNSKYVLADPRTANDDDLHAVEAIVAHEYFHNWTGNRVTCRDWFQLTLKEGLTVYRDQCFSADMHDEGVQRAGDVSMLRAAQFPEDRSPTAHPIRPESYQEINNFYTATVYEKGAEVIRMLAEYLGRDGFRRGMDLYFERHDGQAVTCDDFVAALADANDTDLTAFQGWYEQAGTPTLTVERSINEGANEGEAWIDLRFTQSTPKTAANTPRNPLPIPVRLGFIGSNGAPVAMRIVGASAVDTGAVDTGAVDTGAVDTGAVDTGAVDTGAADEHVLLITNETQTARFAPGNSSGNNSGDILGVTPSLLRGFSAPVILVDDLDDAERLHIMAHDSDMFNRWDAAQTLTKNLIAAELSDDVKTDLTASLAGSYRAILGDDRLLDDFKADVMTFPGISVLEPAQSPADPVQLFHARMALQAAVGRILTAEIDAHLASDQRALLAKSSGGRELLNQMLLFGVAAGNKNATQIAADQVLDDNMSLSQGALRALINSDSAERSIALQAFHDRWQEMPLVMEKWFQMESISSVGGSVDRLRELMKHPAFDPNNPNKLRSVIGAFMAGNPSRFYAVDGSGFDFIADCLIDLDRRNPQVSARMVLPLTRMAAYDTARQDQMKTTLRRIQQGCSSNDLREVVDKAL